MVQQETEDRFKWFELAVCSLVLADELEQEYDVLYQSKVAFKRFVDADKAFDSFILEKKLCLVWTLFNCFSRDLDYQTENFTE